MRDDDEIRVDLPATAVPARRTVLALDAVRPQFGPAVTLELRGPERVALTGRNGAGKTTLLRTIAGDLPPRAGTVRLAGAGPPAAAAAGHPGPGASVAANVARFAPQPRPTRPGQPGPAAVPGRPGRPGGRDPVGRRAVPGHPGRAAAGRPAPQLLLLDEPTNNLDRASVGELTQALRGYRGALLVASHDLPFLRGLGPTRWLRHDGALREIDPP